MTAHTQISILIERLRIHANDKDNKAFARSTMRECIEVLSSSERQALERLAQKFESCNERYVARMVRDYIEPEKTQVDSVSAERYADDLAVDWFAQAMKNKMAEARAKGRGGWDQCTPEVLSKMLREHVDKGDPRDVANFCMMLWNHSARIAAPQAREAMSAEQDGSTPVAWMTYSALTGEPQFTKHQTSELASVPLYVAPQAREAMSAEPFLQWCKDNGRLPGNKSKADWQASEAVSAEQEREAFEAKYTIPHEQRRSESAGGYANPLLQAMWRGWKARAALNAPASMSAENRGASDDAYAMSDAMRMDDEGRIAEVCPSRCAHPSWDAVDHERSKCTICGAIGIELRYLHVDQAENRGESVGSDESLAQRVDSWHERKRSEK